MIDHQVKILMAPLNPRKKVSMIFQMMQFGQLIVSKLFVFTKMKVYEFISHKVNSIFSFCWTTGSRYYGR